MAPVARRGFSAIRCKNPDDATAQALAVHRQAESPLSPIVELDLDVAGAPAGIDLDPIADHIWDFLVSLEDQSRELEPPIRRGDDEALHAGRDESLPQDPPPGAHRGDYR